MSSQLQNLTSQFNTLLTQYSSTYQNYINTLNSAENNLITVPDTSYVGENNYSVINNSTLDNCQTSCVTDTNCSGATFNNNASSCTLTSGTGSIFSTPQSTGIVQEALYYSYQLQLLNAQLLSLNQQMMTTTNSSLNTFQETQEQNQQKEQILHSNYQTLTQERFEIEKMVREFETLNAAYENGNINVTSYYYFYIVLIFVVVFLIGLFMRFSLLTRDNGGDSNWIPIFLVISICIFLVYLLIKR
jgi:hypothetical protein